MLAGCASAPPRQAMRPAPVYPQPPIPPAVQSHPLIMPQMQEQRLPNATSNPPATQDTPYSPSMQAMPTASAPAVIALVTRAEAQTAAGDLGGAEATLERAVQIQPNNPRLWLDFAQLRLAQNQPAEAEQFALRAVQYAVGNNGLRAAWLMVAKTRDAQGNAQGAADARRKAGFQPASPTQTQG
ncbi:MAG TPA: tetratricopeptide repeat protein [Halothiobacillus sp.]|nr:tetratricopeptide repeat protein [Halothiobacillus sp.]HQS28303.1 tetratricopeptide repeat protein [Halothiobacillus sp.]